MSYSEMYKNGGGGVWGWFGGIKRDPRCCQGERRKFDEIEALGSRKLTSLKRPTKGERLVSPLGQGFWDTRVMYRRAIGDPNVGKG